MTRSSPQASVNTIASRRNPNIKAVGELLGEFYGSRADSVEWEKQVHLLVTTYDLDENMVKILIRSKLKAKASSWLKSKADHISINWSELLTEIRKVFHHPPSRVDLQKQFIERRW